jgi:preprotein translocase subunit SecG
MKKITIILLIAVLGISLLLGACASQTESGESTAMMPDKAAIDGGYAAEAPMPEPATEESVAGSGSSDEWGIADLESGNVVLPNSSQKLVYSSDFSINTSEYEGDYKKIKDLLAANDGYVESESTYGQKPTTQNSSGRSSSFLLRVPVDNYEVFISGISGIGELTSKNLYTQDISSNYYDNESRIEVLEERKARLMEHLKAATEMEDVIALEAELSDVLYDLDQLKGTKRGFDKQVDYATVSVYLYEVPDASSLQAVNGSVGDRASNAFNLSMIGIGNFFNEFAVFMAGAFPVIIVILIFLAAAFGIVFGVRKLGRKVKSRPKK